MLITEYRLDLVIQALRAILPLAHPADTTLRYFFKNERIGSNERELVAETVFGVLRHRLLLEHACAGNATPRRMALAHLLRFRGYNPPRTRAGVEARREGLARHGKGCEGQRHAIAGAGRAARMAGGEDAFFLF